MKIAIIGAGITGLSAARELLQNGIHVEVFEKARGLGGRLTTKRLELGNVNIGAQYFTARTAHFAKQTQQWLELGIAQKWAFTPYRCENSKLQISPDEVDRFVGIGGINRITKHLSQNVDIHCKRKISQVIDNGEAYSLVDDQGEHAEGFSHVISTLPAEQSKILFENMADIAQHIPDSIHHPCCAVTLACAGKIDHCAEGFFGDEKISWASKLSAQPGWAKPDKQLEPNTSVWELHYSPKYTEKYTDLADDDIVNNALHWLNHHLACDVSLTQTYIHRWRYAKLKNPEKKHQPVRHKNIIITGDWCFGGRVEGGYTAGLESAHLILNS